MRFKQSIIKNIFIIAIILINNYALFGQHSCSSDTIAMINQIRESYTEINNNINNYRIDKEGTIDFNLYGNEIQNFATGDDSWYAKEILKYYDTDTLCIYKENTRSGAYQIGETKIFKEYYIENGKLFFYYEREIFFSFVNSIFQCYVTEYRVYFCNNNPIRILKKELIWDSIDNGVNYDNYFDYAIDKINTEKNQLVKLPSYKKINEIKTQW